ncbi:MULTISPECIES: aminoglycoside phosphotransferase family protein [unclassified Streptomyces]|uniref:aminoglycoside phosphotransferase family protein n=1 Tax=unclassified Streptomyces TaxID=2593676 RepID=UPI0003603483|nr:MULTISPECIES: aminoglycoside phosphotransferase family protein [unclassified Streptomyces]MYT34283.1 phosphotransferase [Streptomyces sp. SID8354]
MNADRTPPHPPAGTARWHTHDLALHPDRVVKRFRPAEGLGPYTRERRALTLLAAHAPGVAPVLLSAHDPAVPADPPALVMSRLPGAPLRGNPLGERQLTAWAQAVRTVHAALPPTDLARLPLRYGHQRETVERVRAWYARPPDRPFGPAVRRALEAGRDWLDGSGFGAPDAPHGVPPDVPAVFGAGDGNSANYLWDGRRVRVVDFEESGRSDRAYELAEIVEHVSARVPRPFDTAAFLRRFPLTPAESARLRDCRILLALVWLFLLAADDPAHPRNPPGTAERQARLLRRRLDGAA